jgi:SAM-dependent methyltransferase
MEKFGNTWSKRMRNILENRKCPVCNSENKEIVFTQIFNDILGISLDKFEQNITICKDCGMVYTTPFITDEELNNYYSHMSNYEHTQYEDNYSTEDKNKSKRQFEYIKKFIKNHKKVLEIGCATGYLLSIFKKDGFDVLGLEPSAKNKQIAKEIYDVEIETRFLDKGGLERRKFDIVILSHVAEHLKYPFDIFKNIRNILTDDGLLFIEVPDIDYFDEKDLYQFSFEHINYFNLCSTKNLLHKAGFELVDTVIFYNDKSTAPFYPTCGSLWRKDNKMYKIKNCYSKNKIVIQKYIDLINNFRGELIGKINDIIKSHNNIAIWAAGTLTSQLMSQTNILKGNIVAIFDNDNKKDGLKMKNIPIHKPNMNVEYFKEKNIDAIIIGSWSSQDEIYDSLKFVEESGIKVYRLFE